MMLLLKNTGPFVSRINMFWVIVLFFFFQKQHAQEWDLKKDKNGIKVYTRESDSSNLKEYKAVTVVKTRLSKALELITDGDNLWRWNYKTSDSKVIDSISETEFVFWMKNDLPWPIKNRDIISRVKVIPREDGAVAVTITPSETHTYPQEKNSIRITNFSGQWLLTPQGDYVEIIQQLYGDPGGSLPSWVVNTLLTSAPYRTFLNLKKLLEN